MLGLLCSENETFEEGFDYVSTGCAAEYYTGQLKMKIPLYL